MENAPIRGIGYLAFGIFIFSIQDVLIKFLSNGYPIFEILFIRSMAAVVPSLIIVSIDCGLTAVRTRRPGAHLIRAVLFFLSYLFYYLGIAALPLAQAVVLFYTAPFMVVFSSMILFKEQVTCRRWLALSAGFIGVVIILEPAKGTLNPNVAFPIMAAMTYSAGVLFTRRMSGSESASVMGLNLVVFSILVSAGLGMTTGRGMEVSSNWIDIAFLTRPWITPPLRDLGIMIGIGVFVSLGFFSLTQAYRIANSSTIAPFEYVGMLPAVLWGILLWQEMPSGGTLTGALVIIVSGIYLLRLERSQNRFTAIVVTATETKNEKGKPADAFDHLE